MLGLAKRVGEDLPSEHQWGVGIRVTTEEAGAMSIQLEFEAAGVKASGVQKLCSLVTTASTI